jgi:hypothetical protein
MPPPPHPLGLRAEAPRPAAPSNPAQPATRGTSATLCRGRIGRRHAPASSRPRDAPIPSSPVHARDPIRSVAPRASAGGDSSRRGRPAAPTTPLHPRCRHRRPLPPPAPRERYLVRRGGGVLRQGGRASGGTSEPGDSRATGPSSPATRRRTGASAAAWGPPPTEVPSARGLPRAGPTRAVWRRPSPGAAASRRVRLAPPPVGAALLRSRPRTLLREQGPPAPLASSRRRQDFSRHRGAIHGRRTCYDWRQPRRGGSQGFWGGSTP